MRARIVVGCVLAWFAWQAWLSFAAPGKIAPGLEDGTGKVNVLVTLPFEPERFHVLALQRHGRVSGTQDQQVEVRGVMRADLRAIARPYWVKKIEPLRGDQS